MFHYTCSDKNLLDMVGLRFYIGSTRISGIKVLLRFYKTSQYQHSKLILRLMFYSSGKDKIKL